MSPPVKAMSLLLACLVAGPAVMAQESRGMTKKEGPDAPKVEATYRKKWAVIVGINYNPEDRKALDQGKGDRGRIDRLDKAEADAKEFYELLIKYYGYQKDEVILLTGKAATKEAIEGLLQNGFLCDPAKVSADDSVLFYFSGHGVLRSDKSGERGYLIPFDARKTEAGQPDFATAIDTSGDLVKNLRVNCLAKHKLLILDCCHSGAVFRLDEGVGGGRSPDELLGPDLFRSSAFQGLTASREGQVASDGSVQSNHSPFTKALLHAMTAIPQKKIAVRPQYTVSELFHEMQMMLRGALPDDQSPQSWWLDGNRGEFHFFPDPKAEYPKNELTEEERKVFLAMVPTSFGNWWADEYPWFMPSLRYEILEQLPKSKSSDACPDIREIRKMADQLAKTAKAQDYRYKHLASLLATEGVAGRGQAYDVIIKELKTQIEDPKSLSRPLDLHYLGVLHQKRGNAGEAKKAYLEALAAYEVLDKTNERLRALHALCQADYGVLCQTSLFEFDEAIDAFQKARRSVEETKTPPKPFIVYTYSREADAYRRLGRFRLSDRCMYDARVLMTQIDPEQMQPLSAATWKQDAWAFMEQCKFKAAASSFQQSQKILEKLLTKDVNRYQCEINLFHVKHGQALIKRFQGQDKESLALFRKLTPEIAEAIRELDNSQETISNFAELRQLLCERYVNSLERQADCCLFGQVPDFAEAADDYRLALRACDYFPEDRRDAVRLDLLYRRAAALCLPAGTGDVKLALELCREAEKIEERLRKVAAELPIKDAEPNGPQVRKPTKLPTKVQLVRAIARTLTTCDTKSPAADAPAPNATSDQDDLRTLIRGFEGDRLVDRDELERLMFGHKLLLSNRERWGLDRFETTACCDQLLILCDRATRAGTLTGGVDRDFLAYLRPYYDQAFQAKATLTPTPVKELMEIAWGGTRGTPYLKASEIMPQLVLYQAADQFYLLLDVPASKAAPGGLCKCFPLKEEWNDEAAIREACRTDRLLPIPADLRKILAAFGPTQRLTVRWRDPVSGIGGFALSNASSSSVLASDVADKTHFPFDLKTVMHDKIYSDQDDDGELADKSPNRSETRQAAVKRP